MIFREFLKKHAMHAILVSSYVYADQPLGIIGGQNLSGFQPPYAALVSPSGTPTVIITGVSHVLLYSYV